jgi:myosin heavy subunit
MAETDRERPQLRSGELQKLMERIRSTEPHFVRCIKPNQKNVAGSFERKSVVQQLQYQGVLQAIEVSRVGFPVRLKHRQAVTSIF